MIDIDLDKIGNFFTKVGFPMAVCTALIWMMYAGGSYTLQNIAVPMFKKQSEFIDKAAEVTESVSHTIEKLGQTLESHDKELREIKSEVTNNGKKIDSHGTELKSQTEILRSIDATLKKKMCD